MHDLALWNQFPMLCSTLMQGAGRNLMCSALLIRMGDLTSSERRWRRSGWVGEGGGEGSGGEEGGETMASM